MISKQNLNIGKNLIKAAMLFSNAEILFSACSNTVHLLI